MSTPKRFRFTNQLIKSLPPNTSDARSTDAEYSDTEISGLKWLSMIFKKSTTMIIEKYSTEYLKNNLNLDV
ncbi:hypothetical protein NXT90_002692 [Proteus mirabilis]